MKFFEENKNNVFFWVFLALIVALCVILPLRSLDAGNSGDEDTWQYPHAEKVYNYYATGGKDTTYKSVPEMNPYGMWYDTFTVLVCKTFHIDNYQTARHIINSLMGVLAILFTALLAKKLGGWRAAVITLVLLALSPRFIGHSFNNPKDIPFTAMFIVSLYLIYVFINEFRKPRILTAFFLALSIGLAIGVRIGGLLLFAYLGMFVALSYLIYYPVKSYFKKDNLVLVGKCFLLFVGICVVAFGVAMAFWPFLLEAPIKHTVEIFNTMSQYTTSIRQVFEGTLQWSDKLPWYYTPKYILITIPIAVIVGMVLFFIFCWRKKEDRFWAFFVFFTFFFPVFWIVYTHANVYGGWRHAMFAYPPMVVAAGWGFDALLKWIETKLKIEPQETGKRPLILNISAMVVLLLLLAGPIRHIFANHPYEYVYFNELVGGTKNALGNYEMDYYYHSTREASEWVIANAEKNPDGSKVKVATWHTASVQYFFRNDTTAFQPMFVRWYEKENSDWDYAIFTVTGMYPEYLKSKSFPPKNTVKTIDVDGVPICIILKREDKNDYLAFKQKEANNLDSAIMLYHKALEYDGDNLGALFGLGELYVRTGKPDSALIYLKRYEEIDPKADLSNLMIAYAYMSQNKRAEAINVLHRSMQVNPKYMGAYYLAIQIALQDKDIAAAKKEFFKVIDNDRVDNQITQLWVQYSAMQNIDENQAYRNLYKAMIRSLEKRGKTKDAEKLKESIGL